MNANNTERAGALSIQNLVKEFDTQQGRFRAVDGISLDIHSGEFITLLGPSGCGKTTTLRMLAGFEYPSAGRILLDGKDVSAVPPNQRQMAMVFQSYALFPHMTVFENIAYGLRIKHLTEAEIRERVEMALHLINLTNLEERKPNQLSGGQQQRVALARALVVRPKVLLFDEPLSNLDAKLRVQMRTELRRLQRRLGITAIYVTHDQSEAMSLSDRIVVMRNGKIDQAGAPREVYMRSATTFVADFIGRANFIEGTVEQVQNGRATVQTLGYGLQLPCDGTFKAGDPVYIVVRPEALHLSHEGPIACEVKQAAYLGAVVEYDIETDQNSMLAIEYAPQHVFEEGSKVRLQFNESLLHLLPR